MFITLAKKTLQAEESGCGTSGMRISIYYYSTKVLKTTVYSETQTPKSNENGLVTIEIGTGTALKGIFAEIDWPAHLFYIKTEREE